MLKSPDFEIGIFFLAFALLVAVFLVPGIGEGLGGFSASQEGFYTVGPRFFPLLAAGIIGLLSLLLILRSASQNRQAGPLHRSLTGEQVKAVSIFLVIAFTYVALVAPVGLVLTTPLCLAALFWVYGLRRWYWLTVVPLVVIAVIYFCFEIVMDVQLPNGLLER